MSTGRPNDKTTTVRLSIWWEPEAQEIHIASNDTERFITTVNDDPTNRRGHPNLFRKLADILREDGKPAPPPSVDSN